MKGYLVDGRNNNQIIGFYDTKKQAYEYVQSKIDNGEDFNWGSKQEFRWQFKFISKKEMEEYFHVHGRRTHFN